MLTLEGVLDPIQCYIRNWTLLFSCRKLTQQKLLIVLPVGMATVSNGYPPTTLSLIQLSFCGQQPRVMLPETTKSKQWKVWVEKTNVSNNSALIIQTTNHFVLLGLIAHCDMKPSRHSKYLGDLIGQTRCSDIPSACMIGRHFHDSLST